MYSRIRIEKVYVCVCVRASLWKLRCLCVMWMCCVFYVDVLY
jgi:hypothetical protein